MFSPTHLTAKHSPKYLTRSRLKSMPLVQRLFHRGGEESERAEIKSLLSAISKLSETEPRLTQDLAFEIMRQLPWAGSGDKSILPHFNKYINLSLELLEALKLKLNSSHYNILAQLAKQDNNTLYGIVCSSASDPYQEEKLLVAAFAEKADKTDVDLFQCLYTIHRSMPFSKLTWTTLQQRNLFEPLKDLLNKNPLVTLDQARFLTDQIGRFQFERVISELEGALPREKQLQLKYYVLLHHSRPFQRELNQYLHQYMKKITDPSVQEYKLRKRDFAKLYKKLHAGVKSKLEAAEQPESIQVAAGPIISTLKKMTLEQLRAFKDHLALQVAVSDPALPPEFKTCLLESYYCDVLEPDSCTEAIAQFFINPGQWPNTVKRKAGLFLRSAEYIMTWVASGGVAQFFAVIIHARYSPQGLTQVEEKKAAKYSTLSRKAFHSASMPIVIDALLRVFLNLSLETIQPPLRKIVILAMQDILGNIFKEQLAVASDLPAEIINKLNLRDALSQHIKPKPSLIDRLPFLEIKAWHTIRDPLQDALYPDSKSQAQLHSILAYTDPDSSYSGFSVLADKFSSAMQENKYRQVTPFEDLFFELHRAYAKQDGIILSRSAQGSRWTFDSRYAKPFAARKNAEHPDKQVLKVLFYMSTCTEMLLRMLIFAGFIEGRPLACELVKLLRGFIKQAADKSSVLTQGHIKCYSTFLNDINACLVKHHMDISAKVDGPAAIIQRLLKPVSQDEALRAELSDSVTTFFNLLYGAWSAMRQQPEIEYVFFNESRKIKGLIIRRPKSQNQRSINFLEKLKSLTFEQSLESHFSSEELSYTTCLSTAWCQWAMKTIFASGLPGVLSPQWQKWLTRFIKHTFEVTRITTYLSEPGQPQSKRFFIRTGAPQSRYNHHDSKDVLENYQAMVDDSVDPEKGRVFLTTFNHQGGEFLHRPKEGDFPSIVDKVEASLRQASLDLYTKFRDAGSPHPPLTFSVPLIHADILPTMDRLGVLMMSCELIETFCKEERLSPAILPAIIRGVLKNKKATYSGTARFTIAGHLNAWFACGVWALEDRVLQLYFSDVELTDRNKVYQEIINPLLNGEKPRIKWSSSQQRQLLFDLMRAVIDEKLLAWLIHCSEGKDRTSGADLHINMYLGIIYYYLATGEYVAAEDILSDDIDTTFIIEFISFVFPANSGLVSHTFPEHMPDNTLSERKITQRQKPAGAISAKAEKKSTLTRSLSAASLSVSVIETKPQDEWPTISERQRAALAYNVAAKLHDDPGLVKTLSKKVVMDVYSPERSPEDYIPIDHIQLFSTYYARLPLLSRVRYLVQHLQELVSSGTSKSEVSEEYYHNMSLALLAAFGIRKGDFCPNFLLKLLPKEVRGYFIAYPSQLFEIVTTHESHACLADLPRKDQIDLVAELLPIMLYHHRVGSRASDAEPIDDIFNSVLTKIGIIRKNDKGTWMFCPPGHDIVQAYYTLVDMFDIRDVQWFSDDPQLLGGLVEVMKAWIGYHLDEEAFEADYLNVITLIVNHPLAISILNKYYKKEAITHTVPPKYLTGSTVALGDYFYKSRARYIYCEVAREALWDRPVVGQGADTALLFFIRLQVIVQDSLFSLFMAVINGHKLEVSLYPRLMDELYYLAKLSRSIRNKESFSSSYTVKEIIRPVLPILFGPILTAESTAIGRVLSILRPWGSWEEDKFKRFLGEHIYFSGVVCSVKDIVGPIVEYLKFLQSDSSKPLSEALQQLKQHHHIFQEDPIRLSRYIENTLRTTDQLRPVMPKLVEALFKAAFIQCYAESMSLRAKKPHTITPVAGKLLSFWDEAKATIAPSQAGVTFQLRGNIESRTVACLNKLLFFCSCTTVVKQDEGFVRESPLITLLLSLATFAKAHRLVAELKPYVKDVSVSVLPKQSLLRAPQLPPNKVKGSVVSEAQKGYNLQK